MPTRDSERGRIQWQHLDRRHFLSVGATFWPPFSLLPKYAMGIPNQRSPTLISPLLYVAANVIPYVS